MATVSNDQLVPELQRRLGTMCNEVVIRDVAIAQLEHRIGELEHRIGELEAEKALPREAPGYEAA
ncbi:hypothetical protein ACWGB8_02055 [Kitasatospora sp. NPDC054939]